MSVINVTHVSEVVSVLFQKMSHVDFSYTMISECSTLLLGGKYVVQSHSYLFVDGDGCLHYNYLVILPCPFRPEPIVAEKEVEKVDWEPEEAIVVRGREEEGRGSGVGRGGHQGLI